MSTTVRTFNYTRRKKIPRSQVSIRLVGGTPAQFTARLTLEGLDLPGSAKVFIEAYSGRSWTRTFWGTIEEPATPSQATIGEADPAAVAFRVKVVESVDGSATGRILAVADHIQPSLGEDGDRQAILPVERVDLGDAVWRLEFSGDHPRLQVNSLLPSSLEMVRENPLFFGLVFPEVVRQMLTRLLIEDRYAGPAPEEVGWRSDWYAFGQRHNPHEVPEFSEEEEDRSLDERRDWIEATVGRFCSLHMVRNRLALEVLPKTEGES